MGDWGPCCHPTPTPINRPKPRRLKFAGFKGWDGKAIRPLTYTADFKYVEHGHLVVEDVKGVRTQVFRVKAKLFQWQHPSIHFKVVEV